MRRLLGVGLFILLLPVARAEAVTVRDIIDLTKAGIGEEVLLALIEVDGGVFKIDTLTLTMLKQEGVSERVILAMVKSGRTRPAEVPPPPPVVEVVEAPAPPPVVVIDHHERTVPVPVAVPVYVPVYPSSSHFPRRVDQYRRDLDPTHDAYGRGEHAKPAQPVYWGFGGRLRPDAWRPSGVEAPAPANADGTPVIKKDR